MERRRALFTLSLLPGRYRTEALRRRAKRGRGRVKQLSELPVRAARFVLLSDLPSRVTRPAVPGVPSQVSWLLAAANNRAIGRAAAVFPTVAECVADTVRLAEGIDRSIGSVHFLLDPIKASASSWAWSVSIDGRPSAGSSHPYQRRIECERSLRQFLAAVRTSEPASENLRGLGRPLEARS